MIAESQRTPTKELVGPDPAAYRVGICVPILRLLGRAQPSFAGRSEGKPGDCERERASLP